MIGCVGSADAPGKRWKGVSYMRVRIPWPSAITHLFQGKRPTYEADVAVIEPRLSVELGEAVWRRRLRVWIEVY